MLKNKKGSKEGEVISLLEANKILESRLVAAITVTLMFIESGMGFKEGGEGEKRFLALKKKIYDEVISNHL